MTDFELILASTSAYRAQLLTKLHLPFIQIASNAEESELTNEPPEDRAIRLSIAKAKGVLTQPEFKLNNDRQATQLIIGSDQVAHVNGEILHKPGTFEKARQQLQLCSGNTAEFETGIAVLNAQTGQCITDSVKTRVTFLNLSTAQIDAYLELDKPYDCAGSFKSEGLGITLFESIDTIDPNSLVGLPLIKLVSALRTFNYEPLKSSL